MSREWSERAIVMPFDLRDSVGMAILYALMLSIPCLLLLGFIGWVRRLRHELPKWRIRVGLVSLALTLLSWLIFIGPIVAGNNMSLDIESDRWKVGVMILAFPGALLSMAMKRAPRVYGLIAGLLQGLLAASINF